MKHINIENIKNGLTTFKNSTPFNHCIIDDFFDYEYAKVLSNEFPDYESNKWFHYQNPLEDKKALNDWNAFPRKTYGAFLALQSTNFLSMLSEVIGKNLYADSGLHGGGWHMHANGGNLNPHLDYSIHPKVDLQRKLNLIIYLSEDLKPAFHGGHFGLWSHDQDTEQPRCLVKEIEPVFNRAVIFDTTQNSWHGISRPLIQPQGIYRKSMAVYYLCEPTQDAPKNQRALFAPREDQKKDQGIKKLIELRAGVDTSSQVYKVVKNKF
ncbi:2OG-Fe(II) oxygenase [Polynucleobacter paneuropaeus]|uniref:2OG-Fe(II) oxygenase n=1 Tax=Polynucleobacter paneuropaeus TaxID=2527775 RepID=UPI001BFD005D|nr:2OG-Fe(II) oxygenase [Polynucleobacter paneuropaeus]QWD49718.1 2OG-Fe(II) oxygenase [Polynucleobacter paneuropaeus]